MQIKHTVVGHSAVHIRLETGDVRQKTEDVRQKRETGDVRQKT